MEGSSTTTVTRINDDECNAMQRIAKATQTQPIVHTNIITNGKTTAAAAASASSKNSRKYNNNNKSTHNCTTYTYNNNIADGRDISIDAGIDVSSDVDISNVADKLDALVTGGTEPTSRNGVINSK